MNFAKFAIVSLCCLLNGAPQEAAPAAAPAFDIKKLDWIAGTWIIENAGETTKETWFPIEGSTMMGVSHTFDAGQTRFFEFLRITAMNGRIAYVAQPGGGKPVPFLLERQEPGLAVFENPKHDHPQRIRYERTETGLKATISLLDGSRATSFEFRPKPN